LLEISITLGASADSLSINTELMVGVSAREVNSGQLEGLVALSTLLVLKVNGRGLHGDCLQLAVYDLVPDVLHFLLLLLDSLGLRFQLAHHELFNDTELQLFLLLKNLKD